MALNNRKFVIRISFDSKGNPKLFWVAEYKKTSLFEFKHCDDESIIKAIADKLGIKKIIA